MGDAVSSISLAFEAVSHLVYLIKPLMFAEWYCLAWEWWEDARETLPVSELSTPADPGKLIYGMLIQQLPTPCTRTVLVLMCIAKVYAVALSIQPSAVIAIYL